VTAREIIEMVNTLDFNRGLPTPSPQARRKFPPDGRPDLWAGHIGLLTQGELDERSELHSLYARAYFKAVAETA
jgi:hypothetical protein